MAAPSDELGSVLFDRVRAEFDRYNHIPLPVEFKLAELGGDIGLIGAYGVRPRGVTTNNNEK